MLRNEILRIIRKWVFWVMAAGIGIVKFIAVFSQYPGALQQASDGSPYMSAITYYELWNQVWSSFVSYAIPCLCVCAVAHGVADDIECGRYNYMLPRSGMLRYSVVKVVGLSTAAFVCMMLGFLVCCGMMLVWGFPLRGDYTYSSNELLGSGRIGLFYFVKIFEFSTFGVFISLLTMLVSLWIRDWKFVAVLPAMLMYFFEEFLFFTGERLLVWNKWFFPKYIYLEASNYWDADLEQAVYCGIVTLIMLVISIGVLYLRTGKWRKG